MEQTTKEAIAQRNGGKRLSGGAGKKPLIIIGILVAVLAAAYLGLCAYAASLDVFFPNTTINGVDVAGMTVQQAGEELGSTLPQRDDGVLSAADGQERRRRHRAGGRDAL